jgi:hypothetical protein
MASVRKDYFEEANRCSRQSPNKQALPFEGSKDAGQSQLRLLSLAYNKSARLKPVARDAILFGAEPSYDASHIVCALWKERR